MLRRSQILTWSCPVRSLLLFSKEIHVSAVSDNTAAGWQGGRHDKERKCEDDSAIARIQMNSSLSSEKGCLIQLSFNSDIDLKESSLQNVPSKAILASHHLPPQVSAAAKTKQTFYLVSTCVDCLVDMTSLQRLRRTWDLCHTSFNKTLHSFPQQTYQYLHHTQHFIRPFSMSAQTSQISNLHIRPQCLSVLSQQSRAAHQTAPHISNTWSDCLSLVNEDRCRQSLGPNLKLYQLQKETKGTNWSQENKPARWASVLVSLCSVEGQPAILFTLRSSTLKGRHKGDVSFAGGKSDPSDGDVVTTALREAQEELGVTVTPEQVWGVLKPLRDASGMMIAPVLANLGPLEELTFKPNPGEVEEIFTLSLAHLCNPQNRGYTHFRTGNKYGYTLPVFRNGKHRVWGLTAVALEHTLKLIVSR